MTVDPQVFLRLVEKHKSLAFFDIEGTGLSGDYNSVLVVSIRPYGKKVESKAVVRPGDDQAVVRWAKSRLDQMDCWVSYYGKGYDVPMLNTRLFRWGIPPLHSTPHLDLYWTLKANLKMSRRSQGHYLNWLAFPALGGKLGDAVERLEQKMSVSAEVWNAVLAHPKKHIPELIDRCESDTKGLRDLYRATRHLVKEIKR